MHALTAPWSSISFRDANTGATGMVLAVVVVAVVVAIAAVVVHTVDDIDPGEPVNISLFVAFEVNQETPHSFWLKDCA
jgi:hypothetical protein